MSMSLFCVLTTYIYDTITFTAQPHYCLQLGSYVKFMCHFTRSFHLIFGLVGTHPAITVSHVTLLCMSISYITNYLAHPCQFHLTNQLVLSCYTLLPSNVFSCLFYQPSDRVFLYMPIYVNQHHYIQSTE